MGKLKALKLYIADWNLTALVCRPLPLALAAKFSSSGLYPDAY